MRHPTIRDQAGSTLVGVLVLVVVILISTLSVMTIGTMDASLAVRETARAEAFFVAEAGLQYGTSWLEAQYTPPPGTNTVYPLGASPVLFGDGTLSLAIVPDPDNPTIYPKIYTLQATANVGAESRSLQLDVAPECFADFLYFTDHERLAGGTQPIWFVTDDAINGPVHTNDQIHISGDPTFMMHVRSAYGGPDDTDPSHNPMFMYYNGSSWDHLESAAASNPPYDYPTFAEGYTLGARNIELPESAMDEFAVEAQDGGIYIDGARFIQFARPDPGTGEPMHGYVSYRTYAGQPWTDVEIASTNGVMYLTGAATIVGGTVDGQFTVVSDNTISIRDDTTYRASTDGVPDADCDDMLGLVCSGDVVVADTEANQDNCVIHADIITTGGSFTVQNWDRGSPRGTLTVYGGICQEYRGPVGTFRYEGDDVVINTGYVKDYSFDERLLELAPPGFEHILSTGRYRHLAWREVCAL